MMDNGGILFIFVVGILMGYWLRIIQTFQRTLRKKEQRAWKKALQENKESLNRMVNVKESWAYTCMRCGLQYPCYEKKRKKYRKQQAQNCCNRDEVKK